MFWAYRPPSFTFPSMRLEALSAVFARLRKGLLLATKHLSQYRALCLWYENFSKMSNYKKIIPDKLFYVAKMRRVCPRWAGQARQSVSAGSRRQLPPPDFEA
jgi:hypothetical protein